MKLPTSAILLIAIPMAQAQTSQQMEYERQQREYRLQMERQQEQQRQQQKQMEENARRQQEEMRRLNTPPAAPSHSTTPSPSYGTSQEPRSRQQSSGSTSATSGTELKSGPAPKAPPPAKPWVRVVSTAGSDYYIDPTRIRRYGERRQLIYLRNYKEYQICSGKSCLSSRVSVEFDCSDQRTRTLAYSSYTGSNGEGAAVSGSSDLQSWGSVNKVDAELLKAACS